MTTPQPNTPHRSAPLHQTVPQRLEGARYMYRTVKDVRFPLSVRNEVAAMERLLALAKGALTAYPTTLEEDQAALKVCSYAQHGRRVTKNVIGALI